MKAGDLQPAAAHKSAPARLPTQAGQALWRGFRGRCPACGKGRMFRAFLKVAEQCPHCGEELHHHRADDFPAYLVIAIVGHILVPIVLSVEIHIAPPVVVSMMLWPSLALVMALSLLQPVKGAVVAIQWYGGLHGFADARTARVAIASSRIPLIPALGSGLRPARAQAPAGIQVHESKIR